MSALDAGFKILFLTTSASSAVGFHFAKEIHKRNGPSKPIADFSVFMAWSFGLYLFSCLGSSFFCAASGERILAVLLVLLFCLPFALAFWARSYSRADAVFNLQILGLVVGAALLICLDQSVRHAVLLRFG